MSDQEQVPLPPPYDYDHHETPLKDELSSVQLLTSMPFSTVERPTIDYFIAESARVSYQKGTRTINDDRTLTRYLLRHRHTTPFEMVRFCFLVCAPLDVVQQWRTHRTAHFCSFNTESLRYSQARDGVYVPEKFRPQHTSNRQASNDDPSTWFEHTEFSEALHARGVRQAYTDALSANIAREQARLVLPMNQYTEFRVSIDLHNLFHFLALRCDEHAQWEIRQYANAMFNMIERLVPIACEAWMDYTFHAMTLTRLEVDALRSYILALRQLSHGKVAYVPVRSDNARERDEYKKKFDSLTSVVFFDSPVLEEETQCKS